MGEKIFVVDLDIVEGVKQVLQIVMSDSQVEALRFAAILSDNLRRDRLAKKCNEDQQPT